MVNTIDAIVARCRGSASESLHRVQLSQPVPNKHEVLVRMHTSGVNPSDCKVRSGAQGPMISEQVLIHNDGAGEIIAIGEDCTERAVGDRVWLFNVNRTVDGSQQGSNGTCATVVAVPESLAAPLPNNTSYAVGACLGVPAMTAHRAVFCFGNVKGQRVLVTGGAGSVGNLAVQMATAAGAEVVSTVSSAEKADLAEAAGATAVVNYKKEDLEQTLLSRYGRGGIDHIVDVDFAAHVAMIPQVLKNGGTVSAYASGSDLQPAIPYYPLMFNNLLMQMVFVYGMPDAAKQSAIAEINKLLDSERLKPLIAQEYALADVVAAHEMVESGGNVGNVVVTL